MLNDDLQDKLNKMEKMTDHYQVAYCTGVSSGLDWWLMDTCKLWIQTLNNVIPIFT